MPASIPSPSPSPSPDPAPLPLLGAMEAGGTKFILAVGTGPGDLRDRVRIPTTNPAETLAAVILWFRDAQEVHGPIRAFGIGTFGPAGVHPEQPDYGFITTTPKAGWSQTDLMGPLQAAFPVPAGFDTDVNAAALGEWKWGAGVGCDSLVYLTVGTGIGGGAIVRGRPLHGLIHPEMGHLRIPLGDAGFGGICPWHGNCLEGLASGPAMAARWGQPAETLPPGHPAWEAEASYLADACLNILLTLSPCRILLGGGVLQNDHLLPMVRNHLARRLHGYLSHRHLDGTMAHFLMSPGLGIHSGIAGALALAAEALAGQPQTEGHKPQEKA